MPKAKKKITSKIEKKVMDKIVKDEIQMRPKVMFTIGAILLGLGILLAIGAASIFAHIMFVKVRLDAPFAFMRLGRAGISPFFVSFPWMSLLVSIGAIVTGTHLVKKYDFSYKKNSLAVVFGIVSVVIFGGLVLLRLNFEDKAKRVKGIRTIYEGRIEKRPQVPEHIRKRINLRFERNIHLQL